MSLSEKSNLVFEGDTGIADLLRVHLPSEVGALAFETNGTEGGQICRATLLDLGVSRPPC